MNAKRLMLLVAAALIALGIAIALRTAHNAPEENAQQDRPLLPALRDHLNDVSAITVTGAGGKVVATLSRGKDGWTIAERSGYPADLTPIRAFLVKLGRATLIEPKTTNPQRYRDIGVGDVKDKDAKGVLVDIAGLASPTRLIVGEYSAPAQGTFVRLDGEAQSWLASGDLSVPKTVSDWEKRDVVDIAADRVASVTLNPPEGRALKLSRQHPGDAAFSVADLPAGRQLDQGMASTVAATLSALRIDDAFPAKDVPAPERAHQASFATFDGVIVQAVAWTKDGKDYVQFRAALDRDAARKRIAEEPAKAPGSQAAAGASGPAAAPQARSGGAQPNASKPASESPADPQARLEALAKEVAALDRSFSGWTYVLPGYLFGDLTKTMNDLLLPVKSKKPAAAALESRSH
jgi:hypothetical protein